MFLSVTLLSCCGTWANADCEAQLSRLTFNLTGDAQVAAESHKLSENEVSELIKNRFPKGVEQDGGVFWYLTHTHEDAWYDLWMKAGDLENEVVDLKPASERDRQTYVKRIGQELRPERITLPVKLQGVGKVILEPKALARNYIRFGMLPQEIREALENISPSSLPVNEKYEGVQAIGVRSHTDAHGFIKLLFLPKRKNKLVLWTIYPLNQGFSVLGDPSASGESKEKPDPAL